MVQESRVVATVVKDGVFFFGFSLRISDFRQFGFRVHTRNNDSNELYEGTGEDDVRASRCRPVGRLSRRRRRGRRRRRRAHNRFSADHIDRWSSYPGRRRPANRRTNRSTDARNKFDVVDVDVVVVVFSLSGLSFRFCERARIVH